MSPIDSVLLRLRTRYGYLGSMQMHDLPAQPGLVQYYGSAIEKSRSVVEVEGRNRDITKDLKTYILGLNVHIWSCRFSGPNLLEDYFERLFKLITSVCALGKGPWIEYGRAIVEC